jgi:hypothetical protein
VIKVGDIVTLRNRKTRAIVVRALPKQHWQGCVEVNPPLGGHKYHDITDLELSLSKQPLK